MRHVLAVEIVKVTSLIDRVRLLLVIHLLTTVVHLIETSRQICVPTIMCPSFLIELRIGQLVIPLVLLRLVVPIDGVLTQLLLGVQGIVHVVLRRVLILIMLLLLGIAKFWRIVTVKLLLWILLTSCRSHI